MQTPSITPSRTATLTSTPSPSPTPENTRTYTPSPTPYPDLHSAGPYLLLQGQTSASYELDGSGRRAIELPGAGDGSFSPDMKWYAYAEGKLDKNGKLTSGGMVLHILDLWTGSIRDVTELLPPDYYQKQKMMLQRFLDEDGEKLGIEYEEQVLEDLLDDEFFWRYLNENLHRPSWSPDGRHLAFAAMIDGISTDVYVYDIDRQNIQRKDSAYLNIVYIGWSPDGKWILHENDPVLGMRYGPPLQIAEAESPGQSRELTDKCISIGWISWISEDEFVGSRCFFDDSGYTKGIDLFHMNVRTGMKTDIWKGSWFSFAVDKENQQIIINAQDPSVGDIQSPESAGYYLGPIDGKKNGISGGLTYDIIFRGGTAHRFLVLYPDADYTTVSVYGIAEGGDKEELVEHKRIQISLSPDYRWLAVYGNNGITLFDESDHMLYQWAEKPVYSTAWKTNSEGLFFSTEDGVFYIPINTPQANFIFECQPGECADGSSVSLIPNIHLDSLPSLRAQPPTIEKQTQGISLWSAATFRDLLKPGTNEYSVTIPANSTRRWSCSWCGKTQSGLEAILGPFNLEFFIGSEEIGEDIFRMYDSAIGGGFCRTWATLLSGWQPGDSTDLEIRYTLREAVNDGTREYPAGEYRQIIHIRVT